MISRGRNSYIAANCRDLRGEYVGVIIELLKHGAKIVSQKGGGLTVRARAGVTPEMLFHGLREKTQERLRAALHDPGVARQLSELPAIGASIAGIARLLHGPQPVRPDQVKVVLEALSVPPQYRPVLVKLGREWALDADGAVVLPHQYNNVDTAAAELRALDPAQVLQDQWSHPSLRFFPLVQCIHAVDPDRCGKVLTPTLMLVHALLPLPTRMRFILERVSREWESCEVHAESNTADIKAPRAYSAGCHNDVVRMLAEEGFDRGELARLQETVEVLRQVARAAGPTTDDARSEPPPIFAMSLKRSSAPTKSPEHLLVQEEIAMPNFSPEEDVVSFTADKSEMPATTRMMMLAIQEASADLSEPTQAVIDTTYDESREPVLWAKMENMGLHQLGDAAARHPDTCQDVSLDAVREFLAEHSVHLEALAMAYWKVMQPVNSRVMDAIAREGDAPSEHAGQWKDELGRYVQFLIEMPAFLATIEKELPADWSINPLLTDSIWMVHSSLMQSLLIDYLWRKFPPLSFSDADGHCDAGAIGLVTRALDASHALGGGIAGELERLVHVADAAVQDARESGLPDTTTLERSAIMLSDLHAAFIFSHTFESFVRHSPLKEMPDKGPPDASFQGVAFPHLEFHSAKQMTIPGHPIFITMNISSGCGIMKRLTFVRYCHGMRSQPPGARTDLRAIVRGDVPPADDVRVHNMQMSFHTPAAHPALPRNIIPISALPLSGKAQQQAPRIARAVISDHNDAVATYREGSFAGSMQMLARDGGQHLHMCSFASDALHCCTYLAFTPEQSRQLGIDEGSRLPGLSSSTLKFLGINDVAPDWTFIPEPYMTSPEGDDYLAAQTEEDAGETVAETVARLMKAKTLWPIEAFAEIVQAAGFHFNRGSSHPMVFDTSQQRIYTIPPAALEEKHIRNGTALAAIVNTKKMDAVLACLRKHPEWLSSVPKAKRGNGGDNGHSK